jgi:hypothetical protein
VFLLLFPSDDCVCLLGPAPLFDFPVFASAEMYAIENWSGYGKTTGCALSLEGETGVWWIDASDYGETLDISRFKFTKYAEGTHPLLVSCPGGSVLCLSYTIVVNNDVGCMCCLFQVAGRKLLIISLGTTS